MFESGEGDGALLEAGLDLERWNYSRLKARGKAKGGKAASLVMDEEERAAVLGEVMRLAHEELASFCR